HAELFPDGSITRDAFEEVLGALARAGLMRIASAVFEKDGRSIPYWKAALTPDGDALDDDAVPEFRMKVAIERTRPRRAREKAAKKAGGGDKWGREAPRRPAAGDAATTRLEEALRAWRLAEAKRRGVPAFRICSDATLKAIAESRPSTAAELIAIPG